MFRRTISQCLTIRKTTQLYKREFSATNKNMTSGKLPAHVLEAIGEVSKSQGFNKFTLETKALAGIGENSYGLVLQAKINCPQKSREPFFCVLKIAPKNPARRTHTKVVDFYKREVFIYNHVLRAFREFQEEEKIPREKAFAAVPKIYYSSLKSFEELLIVEDLTQDGYSRNDRSNMPDYALAVSSFKALAKYHAMSFVMQAKRPNLFQKLIGEIRYKDNLYTENMDQVTYEFAMKYIGRTETMIKEDKELSNREELLEVVQIFKDAFKEIGRRSVDGGRCAPFTVICHSDFWNNNILYRYDEDNKPTVAKLIDFQMSRYSSPVLDIVHYLFACTEKPLRDAHFYEFMDIYHSTLSEHLRLFNLDPDVIFPKTVMHSHLKFYGPFGFCMAIFAVPFFICAATDFPNLDKVSEALSEISPEGSDTEDRNNNNILEIRNKTKVLVSEIEILNVKTAPIFKRRLIGVVRDLIKYDMVEDVRKFRDEVLKNRKLKEEQKLEQWQSDCFQ